VSSGPVIIADISPHNLPEVLFSEDHDVIETFAPNGPDYSLRKGIVLSRQQRLIVTLQIEPSK
jgi:hypothetical protein